jgi:hypothetical protein
VQVGDKLHAVQGSFLSIHKPNSFSRIAKSLTLDMILTAPSFCVVLALLGIGKWYFEAGMHGAQFPIPRSHERTDMGAETESRQKLDKT